MENSKVHGILSTILKENATKRTNGRVASHRTTTSYGEVLGMCLDRLHELGFRIENPRNLTELHIKVLCEYWHKENKASSTMQDYLSKLRVFAGWVNKKGMVKSLAHYLPHVEKEQLRVSKITKTSKSWTEQGVNIAEKIELADALDERFGLMLRMMLAFGLRREEVVRHQPWKSDQGDHLNVYLGTKGGRPRHVYIDTIEQRNVLDYVKGRIKKNEYIGWYVTRHGKDATLQYSIRRYNELMARIGITKLADGPTGHGLRAEYAENSALIARVLPPTLGGTGGQMNRDDLNVIRAQVSENLGHSRLNITGSYYGTFGRPGQLDVPDRSKKNIELASDAIPQSEISSVSKDRVADCLRLIAELDSIDVAITLKQVHYLWVQHSRRHASAWASLQEDNIVALEAAAISVVKSIIRNESQAEGIE
ncbi:integrase domain-containing protein [Rugamonas sp. A1-17]|nr:integrase domain-containing protein [Rugamonas sp. A1-17]